MLQAWPPLSSFGWQWEKQTFYFQIPGNGEKMLAEGQCTSAIPHWSLHKSGSADFLVERISHCTLFHNRKPTTLLPFSHNNFHSSRLRVAIVVCPGFPVGMPFQQQVLTPIRQHLWKSLMCVWHREQSKQDRRRRCASENGPRVIYSPAIPMNVTFFRKSIRNHYYGFCMSQKAS